MLSLLLAASILAGFGTSQSLGETSPSLVLAADAERGRWRVEGLADSARKIGVPGSAYLLHGTVDWMPGGWLGVGVGQSYRHTSQWSKRVTWCRAIVRSGPLLLLAEVAPASPLREAKAEARLRHCRKGLCVEARGWIVGGTFAQQTDTLGRGFTLLAGYGH
jgi:hypothetical protein